VRYFAPRVLVADTATSSAFSASHTFIKQIPKFATEREERAF
jgi:hypothetical protein